MQLTSVEDQTNQKSSSCRFPSPSWHEAMFAIPSSTALQNIRQRVPFNSTPLMSTQLRLDLSLWCLEHPAVDACEGFRFGLLPSKRVGPQHSGTDCGLGLDHSVQTTLRNPLNANPAGQLTTADIEVLLMNSKNTLMNFGFKIGDVSKALSACFSTG